jgi:hypothetical protein
MLGLTGHEAKLFGILLKRDLVTKEQAMAALRRPAEQRSRDQDRRRVRLQGAQEAEALRHRDRDGVGQGLSHAGGVESQRGRAARTIEGRMTPDPYKELAEQLNAIAAELPDAGFFRGATLCSDLLNLVMERMPMIYCALTRHTELAAKRPEGK